MITIETSINAPVKKVWEYWTMPEHIMKWNFASDNWECPVASNDLRVGGRFVSTMAAKDGSEKFDISGTYDAVEIYKEIRYTMDDGRKAEIVFESEDGSTKIVEKFDPESENSEEMQRMGWQSIMNNFKKHVEAS